MLASLLIAAPQGDLTDPESITQIASLIRWGGVLTSVLVVGVAWLLLRFLGELVDRLSTHFPGRRLSLQKLATLLQFIIYISAVTAVVMLSFRINDKLLAFLGGTVAVSVGFALKDVVASFVAGILILMDRPFHVGDRVKFGGEYGDIVAIGLRSVRLKTLDDDLVTIPNNKFLNDITSCGNYGALDMQVAMDFYVGVDQDVERARQIILEAAVTSRDVFLPKPVVVLVEQRILNNYVALELKLRAYVTDTQHAGRFKTDVNLRVTAAFRAAEIAPPAMLHRMAATGPGAPASAIAAVAAPPPA